MAGNPAALSRCFSLSLPLEESLSLARLPWLRLYPRQSDVCSGYGQAGRQAGKPMTCNSFSDYVCLCVCVWALWPKDLARCPPARAVRSVAPRGKLSRAELSLAYAKHNSAAHIHTCRLQRASSVTLRPNSNCRQSGQAASSSSSFSSSFSLCCGP